MTFNNAKNLHNEDEVTIKETGEHKICEQGRFFLAFCCKVSKMNYIR